MARTLGLGTIIKMDDDDSGSVFTTITLLVSAQPPTRKRARIDGVTLGDTLATDVFGIEEKSDMSFITFWEPADAQHVIFNTLFGAKTQVIWNITYASADIETAEYVIVELNPQGVTSDGLLQIEVVLARMTTLAYT